MGFSTGGRIHSLCFIKKHSWKVPGGIVEEGESIKEAAIREVKEESGYDVKIVKFCGIYQYIGRSVCNFFLGEVIGGQARTSEESLSVSFFSVRDALSVIKNEAIRSWLKNSLDKDKHPFFVEEISQDKEKHMMFKYNHISHSTRGTSKHL